jgi:small subunit ribosomal protein S18
MSINEKDTAPSGDKKRRSSGGATGSAGGMGGGHFFGRRKTCPFSSEASPKIDYKDVRLLGRFVSERGKIVPSRITAVNNKKQRELKQAIKRARFLALLPYVNDRAGA